MKMREIVRRVRRTVLEKMHASHGGRLERMAVSQSQRRIDQGGDSEHRYPELWMTKRGIGYRNGGNPLKDTGTLRNELWATSERHDQGIRINVMDGTASGAGRMHQKGYKTKGPNFIPLTREAMRKHRKGRNPREEGLEPGVDYIIAWHGVTVPQRKIVNLAREDMQEARHVIAESLRS